MARGNKNEAVLKIVEYIKEHAKDNNFIVLRTSDAAEILNSGNTYAVSILDMVKIHPNIEYRRTKNVKGNQPFEFRYVEKQEEVIHQDLNENVREGYDESTDPNEVDIIKQNNQIYESLVENITDFKGFMNNFMEYFTETSKAIIKTPAVDEASITELKTENEMLKEELEKGLPVLEKYESEFKRLNSAFEEKDKALKKSKLVIQTLEKRNEDIITYVQERMGVALAEITNSTVEYMQMPQWKKNPSINAQFQNGIVKIVTNSLNDILHYNDNYNSEE